MCYRPRIFNGNEVSCRTCDACVAARRADWVSRAMAERSQFAFTYSITLTYGNETQFQRDGAEMFRYDDVKRWVANLRSMAKHITGSSIVLRFLVAGEYGDRNKRCHWHVLIFSDFDVLRLGEFKGISGPCVSRDDIISPFPKHYRRTWSAWPHGFVSVQEPDQEGVSYVCSYALKDQFSAGNSEGSGREQKSEVFATGYFAQSRRPALGAPFIDSVIERFREEGYLPVKPHLTIPDMTGYWYPRGSLRERFLTGVATVNAEYYAAHGRNMPQWSTLLNNCADNETDLEFLGYGPTESDEEPNLAATIALNTRWKRDEQRVKRWARRCGSTLPCNACLRAIRPEQVFGLGLVQVETEGGSYFKYTEEGRNVDADQRDGKAIGCNSLCELRGTAAHKGVFYAKSSH